MAKVKITQVRSVIGRNQKQKDTMTALGLRKIRQSREVEGTEQVLGMIAKVKHLIKVEYL